MFSCASSRPWFSIFSEHEKTHVISPREKREKKRNHMQSPRVQEQQENNCKNHQTQFFHKERNHSRRC
jgi:hypothetical protein